MVMKMNPKQKKVGKVMREFKKGELHSGKSGKIVKNPKQAIAIALSEAGMSRKKMATGGSVNESSSRSAYGTQVEPVGGQRRMLPEKKRSAKWY